MDKRHIFEQIIANFQSAQKNAEQERDAAQTEANSHIGRMESRYDTFKQEAQYEVEAHESRILKYKDGIDRIQALLADASILNPNPTIQIGSGIKLQFATGEEKFYILAPTGGGVTITEGNNSIFVLTPNSPLGKQLIGLKIGDTCGRCIVKEIF
jgi:transcription elongation GreA/GreB family factor